MCASESLASCRDILNFGLAQGFIAEVVAQEPRCVQVDAASENPRELILHGEEGETRRAPREELDEHVDIAVRPEIVAQDRSEERELPDAVTAAESSDFLAVDRDPRGHGTP